MITTRELNYVTSWANKTPYPGTVYAEQATEKLFEAVENYEKFYANKEYDIILSNGEQISFEILNSYFVIICAMHSFLAEQTN